MHFAEEFGIKFITKNDMTWKWKRNMYDANLQTNRAIVCCALNAAKFGLMKRLKSDKAYEMKCFDGTGGCGIYSLLWLKYLHDNCSITVSDVNSEHVAIMTQNHTDNNLTPTKLLKEDPCIVLRQQCFDFIFLNCDTKASCFFDSAFCNLQEDSVLVITTSEDPSLYWQAPDVAFRNYGAVIGKLFCHREFAARVVIGAMAQSAAKYNKQLIVLCTLAFKSHQAFTIIVTVKNGAKLANASLTNCNRMIYCTLCEEWAFIPNSNFIQESLTGLLTCECSKSPGKCALDLGPLWSGKIFQVPFISSMIEHSKNTPWEITVQGILAVILTEAQCAEEIWEVPPVKKAKLSTGICKQSQNICFHINTHRHNPKNKQLLKIATIINFLKKNGYIASPTHFDPEGIRTNISVSMFKQLIETYE